MKIEVDEVSGKVTVELPKCWSMTSEDHDEFGFVSNYYKLLGIDVGYEVIFFAKFFYAAIFWVGEKPEERLLKIKQFISEQRSKNLTQTSPNLAVENATNQSK